MLRPTLIPRPGIRFGSYPEKKQKRLPRQSYFAEWMRARMLSEKSPSRGARADFLDAVGERRQNLRDCDIEFISASARRLRARLILEGLKPEMVAESFALIDASMRFHMNITLHDTQLLAAWLMLEHRLVEMQTGEGKTLAVALAAATGALAGIPVHVITANDYLVGRDANMLRPVFQTLGLTVGAIRTDTPASERPRIYRSDVTYCIGSELVFDYLRDHLNTPLAANGRAGGKQERNLRGLCMAIIDEADSVLVDEARMPLILSGGVPDAEQSAFYRQALFLAAQLKPEEDFLLDEIQRRATLTLNGQKRAEALSRNMDGSWAMRRRREETLCLALAARHLFVKGRHYLVRDKHVVIIDDTTGRTADGRVWSQGLHQLIETKENCPLTEQQHTLTQTTFQRFFSRYLRLSGISGTLMEAKGQLLAIYGLPVLRIPTHLPSRRKMLRGRVFPSQQLQWRYVVQRVADLHAQGRPVLIGTDSVSDSELLSEHLTQAGIKHTVLNACFDAEEAEIIAKAGQKGAVTVSTNMAGRGTDIRLGEGVGALGGLHVLACQTNHSKRIDRQLYGRCARQGEPGSVEHLHCIQQGAIPVSKWALLLAGGLKDDRELPKWFTWLAYIAQKKREKYRQREQWYLFLNEWQVDRQLSFSGESE